MRILLAALAAVTLSAVATLAQAQQMTPPANDPIKRTPLQKIDYPDGHSTYVMMIEIQPNATIGRHTHPGIETSYVLEGELELVIGADAPKALKTGDSFAIPPNAVHGGKTGSRLVKLIGTFVVDKTKPLASPAP
jgi:quercetin dioxygenase-like cupin family protein